MTCYSVMHYIQTEGDLVLTLILYRLLIGATAFYFFE